MPNINLEYELPEKIVELRADYRETVEVTLMLAESARLRSMPAKQTKETMIIAKVNVPPVRV